VRLGAGGGLTGEGGILVPNACMTKCGERLTRREFWRLLRCGKGRAIRYVNEHGDQGFEDLILKASLKQIATPWEDGDHRVAYIAALIDATRKAAEYGGAFVAQLSKVRGEKHHRQVARFLAELACRKFAPAREALEEIWRDRLTRKFDGYAQAWIAIERERGYRQVLENLVGFGKRWHHEHSYLLHFEANDVLGESRAKRIRSEYAARYPQHPELLLWTDTSADERRPSRVDPSRFTFEAALKLMEEGGVRSLAVWGTKAPPSELMRAAETLATEADPDRRVKLLGAFRHSVFPLAPQILMDCATVESRTGRWAAMRAMSKLRDPRVREFALNKLDDEDIGHAAISLLALNFDKCDVARLHSKLAETPDGWEFHGMAISVKDVIKANPHGRWEETLRLMLDRGDCGLCRESVVKLMAKRRLLTDEDWEDLLYDSHEYTRRWARRHLNQRHRRVANMAASRAESS
jgi:hypothetical protein